MSLSCLLVVFGFTIFSPTQGNLLSIQKSGNKASLIVYSEPSIDHSDYGYITYQEGTLGHNITWVVSENNPTSYEIYRRSLWVLNGSLNESAILIESGNYSDDVPITINIDHLPVGWFSFTLSVSDWDGFQVSDCVWVTVIPPYPINPVILDSPDNVNSPEGWSGDVYWIAMDDNSTFYQIIVNEKEMPGSPRPWNSGEPVGFTIALIPVGVHNYTIIFHDSDNNTVSNTVLIVITNGISHESSSTTTTRVFITSTADLQTSDQALFEFLFSVIFLGSFFSFGLILLSYRIKQRIRFVKRLFNRKSQIGEAEDYED